MCPCYDVFISVQSPAFKSLININFRFTSNKLRIRNHHIYHVCINIRCLVPADATPLCSPFTKLCHRWTIGNMKFIWLKIQFLVASKFWRYRCLGCKYFTNCLDTPLWLNQGELHTLTDSVEGKCHWLLFKPIWHNTYTKCHHLRDSRVQLPWIHVQKQGQRQTVAAKFHKVQWKHDTSEKVERYLRH